MKYKNGSFFYNDDGHVDIDDCAPSLLEQTVDLHCKKGTQISSIYDFKLLLK